MDETLYCLCRHCVGMIDGWVPYPAWCIAEQTNVSVSTARRRLRKLKALGLVETEYVLLDDGDMEEFLPPPYHGWTITKKAFYSDEYLRAVEEENKIEREIWGLEAWA